MYSLNKHVFYHNLYPQKRVSRKCTEISVEIYEHKNPIRLNNYNVSY